MTSNSNHDGDSGDIAAKPADHLMLFAGLPTYGRNRVNTLSVLDLNDTLGDRVSIMECSSSFLTATFNHLWCAALNLRETRRITHFLLLHDDVIPLGHAWIQTLLDEMQRVDAKVLSLIMPVKDKRGLVSTALDDGSLMPVGFTTSQIQNMPVTFTHDDLLINTGCLLVKFDEPWVERICFTVHNAIRRNEKTGKFEATAAPEDYDFSRQCRKMGIPVWATRKVKAEHMGHFRFPNYEAWGPTPAEIAS